MIYGMRKSIKPCFIQDKSLKQTKKFEKTASKVSIKNCPFIIWLKSQHQIFFKMAVNDQWFLHIAINRHYIISV